MKLMKAFILCVLAARLGISMEPFIERGRLPERAIESEDFDALIYNTEMLFSITNNDLFKESVLENYENIEYKMSMAEFGEKCYLIDLFYLTIVKYYCVSG